MGSTVTRGEVEATVTATGTRTFFGKTAVLIQSVRSEGNLQRVLMRVMVTLLVASFVLCGVALVYLLVDGEGFRGALEYTITLLVASIPLAIEIVRGCCGYRGWRMCVGVWWFAVQSTCGVCC